MLLLIPLAVGADVHEVRVAGHGTGETVADAYDEPAMRMTTLALAEFMKGVNGYPDTSKPTPHTTWSTPGWGDTKQEALRNAHARSEILMDRQKEHARDTLRAAMTTEDASAAAADYRLYMHWTVAGSELTTVASESSWSAKEVRITWTGPRCLAPIDQTYTPKSGAGLDAYVTLLCRQELANNEIMIFEASAHAAPDIKQELWDRGTEVAEECFLSCMSEVVVTPVP